MRLKTLGLILIIIGTIGGLIAHLSGLFYNAMEFTKMGFIGNSIQLLGLAGVFVDKD